MTRSRKWILGIAIFAATVCAFATVPALRTSIPGRVVRFCRGEPGATQWVNDASDKIVSSAWIAELHTVSDRLMREEGPTSLDLPIEPFSGGRSLAVEKLPVKFRQLGGSYADPDLVMRVSELGSPTEIVVSWGHMRQSIIVFASPPQNSPRGFFVRKVSDRIYVVANES